MAETVEEAERGLLAEKGGVAVSTAKKDKALERKGQGKRAGEERGGE